MKWSLDSGLRKNFKPAMFANKSVKDIIDSGFKGRQFVHHHLKGLSSEVLKYLESKNDCFQREKIIFNHGNKGNRLFHIKLYKGRII